MVRDDGIVAVAAVMMVIVVIVVAQGRWLSNNGEHGVKQPPLR